MNITVENFGKIESADISLKKMMFFIGDNNSGKSYLMSLLYGLLKTEPSDLLNKFNFTEKVAVPPELSGLAAAFYEGSVFRISEEQFEKLVELINNIMEVYKDYLVRDLLGDDVTIGVLRLEIPFFPVEVTATKGLDSSKLMITSFSDEKLSLRVFCDQVSVLRRLYDNADAILFFIVPSLIQYAAAKSMGLHTDMVYQIDPVFFPVSRTGFMLTYKTLMTQAIEDQFNPSAKNEKLNMLTLPERDFLKNLSQLNVKEKTDNESRLKIARFIQKELIDGSLKVSDLPVADIVYCPGDNASVQLPLYVSSGVVTELTPILLQLLYGRRQNCIMIEEPEMCLHPELQQKIARMLIKMANSGFTVMVTTHSDIIMQHINNMIILNRHANRDAIMNELGYDMDDLLASGDAAVYQFSINSETGKTRIEELDCGNYGFELPTFINALDKLYDHSSKIVE
ncbi:MAG: AAA family ATPase [Lachnospiraceae bacterium]|nr:AAA family ATPase [Lachnospiraceae bacterium]